MADQPQHFLQNLIGDGAAGRSANGGIICSCRPQVNPTDAKAGLAQIIDPEYSTLIPIDIERERSGEKWCWTVVYFVNSQERGTHLQDEFGDGPMQCKDGSVFYKEASMINPTGCVLQGETRNGFRLMMVNKTALRKVTEAAYNALPPNRRFMTSVAHFERLPNERRRYPKAHHFTVCAHCRAVRMRLPRKRRSRRRQIRGTSFKQ